MRYVKLGTSGLEVSPIAIGAMTYGDPARGHPSWSLPNDEARPLIKHAIDRGINFFDTANMYSLGSSEKILGQALRDFAIRDEVVIATKVRFPTRSGPNASGLSRKAIMAEVDHSLERLGVDYIDLYQIHRNDHSTPLEETLDALNDVVRAGKVRYLGASSMPAWEFAKARYIQRSHGWAPFVSMQHHYNLLAREEEREMVPLCLDEGVRTIAWSPLARGRLARPQCDTGTTTRSTRDDVADVMYNSITKDSDQAILDAVGVVAEARGVARAQIALAWLLSKPVVAAPLVGASSITHIDQAVASLEIDLESAEIDSLEASYTPRQDFQGIADDAVREAAMARIREATRS